MKKIITQSPEETQKAGAVFAGALKPGDIVGFEGELGAGKTCMIQGVCRALGVTATVNSPTYTLINKYQGRYPVYHIDYYRIKRIEEFKELGLEEIFGGNNIALMEWAQRFPDSIPGPYHVVNIKVLEADKREIHFSNK
jgi:tRNA threonylcarbamoyladenosine biosynthesis protein TsaE